MNLLDMAEEQLIREKENGQREKITLINVIDYAVKIRKWLDKRGGDIEGILNQLTYSSEELRRQRYLQTGR